MRLHGQRAWVPRRSSWTAALALLTLLSGPASAQVQADHYQGPYRPDPALVAIEARPVWRDHQDDATALVTATAVVYLRDGRLVATELTSGWQQWSYGSGITGPITLVGRMVIVAESGRLTALDAADGTVLWTTEAGVPAVDYLEASGDFLLLGSAAGGYQAHHLLTGELSHTFAAPGPAQPVHLGGALLVLGAVHGEPGALWFHGYATDSGVELWRGRSWQRLLGVREGLAYLLNLPGPAQVGSPAGFSVSVVNAATGTRVDHWQYGFGGALEAWQPGPAVKTVMTDDTLYVSDGAGHGAYRFPLGGAAQPSASYGAPDATLIAGPYNGLLFFETSGHELLAAAIDGGGVIRYTPAGTRFSRVDLVGPRAFVGRTDGTFLAVDITSARARYMLSTGGLGFGPTLHAGAFVVVQGGSELIVLEVVE